jgi:SAM-dependent methyltransferase
MARLGHTAPPWWSRAYLTQRALGQAIATATQAVRAPLWASSPFQPPRVLDLGCGHKPYAALFQGWWHIGVNWDCDDASPDLLADAAALPLCSEMADLVLCTQVLEHVPQPAAVLAEAWRVLRPGGVLLLSAPFFWPLHEEPHDYYRYTRHGLQHLLEQAGFEAIHITPDCASLTTAVVVLMEALPRATKPLWPLINVLTPWLQKLSNDRQSTLNWVATARRPIWAPTTEVAAS